MSGMLPPSHGIRPSTSSGSFRSGGFVPPSTSSNAASRPGFVHTTLTLDAALAQANGDTRAALDAVITERNMLSSQNAQLWKLIEKQRVGYAGVMKELDRVRAERDKAVNKLDGTDGGAARSTSAKLRPSPSAPATSSSGGQLRSYSVEESSSSGGTLGRPRPPPRQQSDQSHGGMSSSAICVYFLNFLCRVLTEFHPHSDRSARPLAPELVVFALFRPTLSLRRLEWQWWQCC